MAAIHPKTKTAAVQARLRGEKATDIAKRLKIKNANLIYTWAADAEKKQKKQQKLNGAKANGAVQASAEQLQPEPPPALPNGAPPIKVRKFETYRNHVRFVMLKVEGVTHVETAMSVVALINPAALDGLMGQRRSHHK